MGPTFSDREPSPGAAAFSLVEMLVSLTVVVVITVLTSSVISQATRMWQRTSHRIDAWQEARTAFERLTRHLGQATLQPYLDYDDPVAPTRYDRHSDLHFILGPAGSDPLPGTSGTGQAIFFQAPAGVVADHAHYEGLEGLLNAVGYYVEYGTAPRPDLINTPASRRYRLRETVFPAEANRVYGGGNAWLADAAGYSEVVADNVIALIVRPRSSGGADGVDLSADYTRDTRAPFIGAQPESSHQLPPIVEVTLIALSEESARRLESGPEPPAVIAEAFRERFRQSHRYAEDLAAVREALREAGLEFWVFESAVMIGEARWQP